MRYREVNDVKDFSHDVDVVINFIGQDECRHSLETIRHSLRSKGFVSAFDDASFALELDLWNLELLRVQCAGDFQSLPEKCHAGVDFLFGLGQTIPILSEAAKTRLLGRIRKGLQEGLWPLQHELRIAANLSKRGWDIRFHDFEEGGGYDFLVTKNGMVFEVEAKAISLFTGWPIKPGTLNTLLVEVKEHFIWEDVSTIPLIGVTFPSHLTADRTGLQELVFALAKVARTREKHILPQAEIRFIGTVQNMTSDKLLMASHVHSRMARKIVLVNPNPPRLVLELDSKRPIQLERRIIRTVSEAARGQFSRSNPGVIWTHVNFISDRDLAQLRSTRDGKAGLFDRIASATLFSQKRNHLSQLVFSGGSFLDKTGANARSSYTTVVYDSPVCRFGKNVIFEGGRKKKPSPVPGVA